MKVLAFRPSPRAQWRFDEVTRAIQDGVAASDERAELDDCIGIEHGLQFN